MDVLCSVRLMGSCLLTCFTLHTNHIDLERFGSPLGYDVTAKLKASCTVTHWTNEAWSWELPLQDTNCEQKHLNLLRRVIIFENGTFLAYKSLCSQVHFLRMVTQDHTLLPENKGPCLQSQFWSHERNNKFEETYLFRQHCWILF